MEMEKKVSILTAPSLSLSKQSLTKALLPTPPDPNTTILYSLIVDVVMLQVIGHQSKQKWL